MSTRARSGPSDSLSADLVRGLGPRRSARLRAIIRQSGLPPGPLLDLALDILDLSSRKLSPPPMRRTAIGLGAARWRGVSAEKRSELLRQVVQARWAKRKKSGG